MLFWHPRLKKKYSKIEEVEAQRYAFVLRNDLPGFKHFPAPPDIVKYKHRIFVSHLVAKFEISQGGFRFVIAIEKKVAGFLCGDNDGIDEVIPTGRINWLFKYSFWRWRQWLQPFKKAGRVKFFDIIRRVLYSRSFYFHIERIFRNRTVLIHYACEIIPSMFVHF